MDAPTLLTPRLVLRPWREADLAPLARINADPRVAEFLGPPMTRAESDLMIGRFLQKWSEEPRFGWWALEHRGDGATIGFAGLATPDFEMPATPCVEAGWRLDPAYWGRGLATEAARACLEHGFATVGLDEIVSFTVPANVRSRAVMDRLGMVEDAGAAFDHPMLPEGDPLRRHVLYRIDRREHERRRRCRP